MYDDFTVDEKDEPSLAEYKRKATQYYRIGTEQGTGSYVSAGSETLSQTEASEAGNWSTVATPVVLAPPKAEGAKEDVYTSPLAEDSDDSDRGGNVVHR